MPAKAEQVHIRCSSSQRDAWEHAAELDRRTLTDWIRIQLDDAAKQAIEAAEKKSE
jgi:uncharacterized protein (DUF1778 family)